MDYDAAHTTSVSGYDIKIDKVIRESQNVDDVLTRFEFDLVWASEKLLNISGFTMHVATKESDLEAFLTKEEQTTVNYVEKALEFTLLSGILDSVVSELDVVMVSLQTEIIIIQKELTSYSNLEEPFAIMEEKLQDLKQLLKQVQEQIPEIRMQSMKFQKNVSCSSRVQNWNNNISKNVVMKLHPIEQQRHILRMLEKSLAREMDLEKKLIESKQMEEDLKRKLLSLHKLENSNAKINDFFQAQTESLNHSLKEVEDKLILSNFEALTLEKKVSSLKNEINDIENVITNLEEKESKAVGRARNAEAKCKILTDTNTALNEELEHLKTQLTEPCGCTMPWQISGLWKM